MDIRALFPKGRLLFFPLPLSFFHQWCQSQRLLCWQDSSFYAGQDSKYVIEEVMLQVMQRLGWPGKLLLAVYSSALKIQFLCFCNLTTELPSAIKPPSPVELQVKTTVYLQVPAAWFLTPWETFSSPLWWGSWQALSPNTTRTQRQECCPYVRDRLFCNFEAVNFPFCLLRSSFSKYESLLQEEKIRPLWLKV